MHIPLSLNILIIPNSFNVLKHMHIPFFPFLATLPALCINVSIIFGGSN